MIFLFLFFIITEASNLVTKFKVAVVDNDNTIVSDLVINIISNQDISENIAKFETTTIENAKIGVIDNNYMLAVELPKDCINNIRFGKKSEINIYINDKYKIINEIINNIVKDETNLLIAGQYGVFVGENVLTKLNINQIIKDNNLNLSYFNINGIYSDYIKKSNLNLISFALNGKNDVFYLNKLSYANSGIGLIQFYFIAFLLVLIILGRLPLFDFYNDDCKENILSRLRTYKIYQRHFLIGKIIIPTITSIVFLSLLYFIFVNVNLDDLFKAILSNITNNNDLFLKISLIITDFKNSIININTFIMPLVFAILLINIWTMMCGIIFNDKYNYKLWIIAVTVLSLYLIGGIVPRSMMPSFILDIMSYSPFFVAFNFLSVIVGGILNVKIYILGLIYLILPIIIIHIKLKRIVLGKN